MKKMKNIKASILSKEEKKLLRKCKIYLRIKKKHPHNQINKQRLQIIKDKR
jgi:hypothetical protein